MRRMTVLAVAALLSACQQRTEDNANSRNVEAPAPAVATNETTNQATNDRPAPLAEPKGPIDPKSAEGAGQVVQHYGALIEQGRWKEAAAYWGDAAAAAGFENQLRARGLKHLEIGEPGQPEGAAGSIYVTMPVFFYEGSKRAAADIILRRVNDVPGSTEAQRRWHIERIEWKP